MTFEEFRSATSEPDELAAPLRALWQDAEGNWESAHRLVQDDASAEAAWVHAYLHRKEGDAANAGYWYARAGKPRFDGSLESEWEEMVQVLLSSE